MSNFSDGNGKYKKISYDELKQLEKKMENTLISAVEKMNCGMVYCDWMSWDESPHEPLRGRFVVTIESMGHRFDFVNFNIHILEKKPRRWYHLEDSDNNKIEVYLILEDFEKLDDYLEEFKKTIRKEMSSIILAKNWNRLYSYDFENIRMKKVWKISQKYFNKDYNEADESTNNYPSYMKNKVSRSAFNRCRKNLVNLAKTKLSTWKKGDNPKIFIGVYAVLDWEKENVEKIKTINRIRKEIANQKFTKKRGSYKYKGEE